MGRTQDLIHTQVNLDQCTGKFVIRLRAVALTMQHSYERVNTAKTAVIAACATIALCPEAIQTFDVYAKVERNLELAAKAFWEAQSLIWKTELTNHCSLPLFTSRNQFPEFPFPVIPGFFANISDLKTLSFSSRSPPLLLSLHYQNLTSSAQLRKEGDSNAWSIRWAE